MDIFVELQKMQQRILAADWGNFETHYEQLCQNADREVATRITDIQLDYYNDRQFDAYCKALKKARRRDAKAIYFEYDMDNDWDGSFFVCLEYNELDVGDDDWACRWAECVPGSNISEFTEVYEETEHFCQTPKATAITLYLIARTTMALQSTIARKPASNVVICLGFHDQDPIHRLWQ